VTKDDKKKDSWLQPPSTAVTAVIAAGTKTMKSKDRIIKKKPFIVRRPVATTVKQISRYISIDEIVSEISRRRHEWPQVILEELSTNSWDFLKVYYPPEDFTKEQRQISARIRIDDIPGLENIKLLRTTVRNSNVDRHDVFQDLSLIFDYDKWQSTKRNQYLGTGGALGDFLKRSLGMGYASWTLLKQQSASDQQWTEPLILRFNGQEYQVYLEIDTGINAGARIEGPFSCPQSVDYVEVCATLPMENEGLAMLPIYELKFFKAFRLGKGSTTTMDFVVENIETKRDSE
jgi:hypothetical protein